MRSSSSALRMMRVLMLRLMRACRMCSASGRAWYVGRLEHNQPELGQQIGQNRAQAGLGAMPRVDGRDHRVDNQLAHPGLRRRE